MRQQIAFLRQTLILMCFTPVSVLIDSCEDSNGVPSCASNATCLVAPGVNLGYRCDCQYSQQPSVGFYQCENMCPPGSLTCRGSSLTCHVNNDGSQKCGCVPGFHRKTDGEDCKDVNECASGIYGCGAKAFCVNVMGDYNCECNKGYDSANPKAMQCKDIDECKHHRNKSWQSCDSHSTCLNNEGSFICQCNPGWRSGHLWIDGYDNTSDIKTFCKDTDECSDQVENHNCGNYTQCINTPGSFECQCLLGLFQKQPDFETSKSCTPIDICGAERHLQKPQCHQEAICEDLIGNYTCRCKFGFKGNGSSCIVDDPCKDVTQNDCDKNAYCNVAINPAEGDPLYGCICKEGYIGNGTRGFCNQLSSESQTITKAPNQQLPKGCKPYPNSTFGTVESYDTGIHIMGFYKLGTQARVSCKHPYKAEPDPPISICKLDGNKAIWSFSSCGLINSPVPEIKYDSNAINIPKEGCGDFPNISFAVVVNYTQAKNRETDLFPIGTNVKVKCIGSFKNEESVACQPDGTWKNARCNDENGQHRLAGPAIGCPDFHSVFVAGVRKFTRQMNQYGHYPIGTSAFPYCIDTNESPEPDSVICEQGGQWSASVCLPKRTGCDAYPGSIAGSATNYSDKMLPSGKYPIGSSAFLTCTSSYKTKASPPFVVCSPQGIWGDSTCWPHLFPQNSSNNNSSMIGPNSDGCGLYPENPYGGVTTYFGLRSFNGAYPIGSEASVYCNEGLAQPRSIRCQPGGFWQSFFCHPTLAISPKKPPNNEWLKEMQIASKQGGTGSTLTLEQGVTKFDSSVLSITSRWRFPGGPAVTSSIIGDMTTNVQQTIEIGPDAGCYGLPNFANMVTEQISSQPNDMGFYPRDTKVMLFCILPYLKEPKPPSSYCMANGVWSVSFCWPGPGLCNPYPENSNGGNTHYNVPMSENGKYPAGTTAFLYCKNPHADQPTPPYAICSPDGIWNTDSTCWPSNASSTEPGRQIGPTGDGCHDFPESSLAWADNYSSRIVNGTYSIGSKVNFHCGGKIDSPTSPTSIKCLPGGTWEDAICPDKKDSNKKLQVGSSAGCFDYPKVANGGVLFFSEKYSDFGFYPKGTKASLYCNAPYQKTPNPPDAYCLATGHWSTTTCFLDFPQEPNQSPGLCGEYPQNDYGGVANYSIKPADNRLYPMGTRAHLKCNTPAQQNPTPPYVVCSPDGQWGDSSCWPIEFPQNSLLKGDQIGPTSDGCGDFPTSPYGGVLNFIGNKSTSGTYPVGTQATLFCDDKYLPPIPPVVTCLAGGKWDSADCKPKSTHKVTTVKIGPAEGCYGQAKITHGNIRAYTNDPSSLGFYPRGTEAYMQCDPPYKASSDPPSSFCMESGMWSDVFCWLDEKFNVQGKCATLSSEIFSSSTKYDKPIENGFYPTGTVVTPVCNGKQNSKSTCDDKGLWTPSPKCTSMVKGILSLSCPPYPSDTFGTSDFYSEESVNGKYNVGTKVKIICRGPYKPTPTPVWAACVKTEGSIAKWTSVTCAPVNSTGDGKFPDPNGHNLGQDSQGCRDLPPLSYVEILNYTFTKNKVTLLYPVGTQAKMRCKAPYKHDQIISTCQPGGIWSESQCQSNNVTDSSAPVGPLAGCVITESNFDGVIYRYDRQKSAEGLYPVGTLAYLKCSQSNEKAQPNPVVCLKEGKWSASSCEKPATGCGLYPENTAGKALNYSQNPTDGQFPIFTVAYLACNSPYKSRSSPPSAVCSPHGSWGDGTCWPSTFPQNPSNDNSSMIGPMSDGCSDFPANPYGKVKFYFNQKSKTGVFPVGTKATVTCVEGNPSPVEIICLLGSKWQSFDCPITAPVVPHDRIALPIGTAAESIFTIQSSIRISDLPVTTMNSTGIADKFSIKIGPENGCYGLPKFPHMKAVKVTNAMSQMGYYPRDTEVELSCDIPFLTEPIPHSSYCLANGMWSESYCSRGPGFCGPYPENSNGGVDHYSEKLDTSGLYPIGTQAYLYCKNRSDQVPTPPYAVCSSNKVWNTDSTCWSSNANESEKQLGPQSDGCVEFPSTIYFGAANYSAEKTSNNNFPSGTTASLFCASDLTYPQPRSVKCQPGGIWENAICPDKADSTKTVDAGPKAGCFNYPQLQNGGVERYDQMYDDRGFYPLGTKAILFCNHPDEKIPDPPFAYCLATGHWSSATCFSSESPGSNLGICTDYPNNTYGGVTKYSKTKSANGMFPAGTHAYLTCISPAKSRPTPPYVVCSVQGKWSDSSCWPLNFPGNQSASGDQIGPNSDGCGEFPTSDYGGAHEYTNSMANQTYPTGTETNLFCSDNYQPPVPLKARCLPGGKWESATCMPKLGQTSREVKIGPEMGCFKGVPKIVHGKIRQYSHVMSELGFYPRGTEAYVVCSEPFRASSDPPSSFCMATGQWSDVYCWLKESATQELVPSSGPFAPTDKAQLSFCRPYVKNSFVSSVAYNNPQFDGGLYPAGTLATLTCADLKAHAAPDAVICFDGTWSESTCWTSDPKDPANKTNGKMLNPRGSDGCGDFPKSPFGGPTLYSARKNTDETYAVDTTVDLYCSPGYRPPNPSKVKCIIGGNWESSVCVPEDTSNPKTPIGSTVGSDSGCFGGPKVTNGRAVEFSKTVDQKGYWPPKTSAVVVCNDGYHSPTPSLIFCLTSGNWSATMCWSNNSHSAPHKDSPAGCPEFPINSFARVVDYTSPKMRGGYYPVGSFVILLCNEPRYKPSPSPAQVVCKANFRWGMSFCFEQNGKAVAVNQEGCGEFPQTSYGGPKNQTYSGAKTGADSLYPHGTTVSLYCKSPVYKDEPQPTTATCTNGMWSGAECIPQNLSYSHVPLGPTAGCPKYSTSEIGGANGYDKKMNSRGNYEIGTKATLYCNTPTYEEISKPDTVECLASGRWEDAVCLRSRQKDSKFTSCPKYPETDRNEVLSYNMPKQEASEEYPVGTQAVLACKGPYHSIPSPNIVVCSAEKGSWSDATCYSKDSPIGPQNTNPNQIGPTAVGCTEFPPSKVGWAKDPTSKISTAGTYQVGTEVTLVCGMGYQNPPHPAKVKCLESGKWGDSVCTPDNNTISKAILGPSAGCFGAPDIPFGGVKSYSDKMNFNGNFPVGTVVEIYCNPPYDQGPKPPKLACMANGHWSDVTKSSCANKGTGAIGCSEFPKFSFGSAKNYSASINSGGYYDIGTSAFIQCNPPTYKPNPTPVQVFCLEKKLRWGSATCWPESTNDSPAIPGAMGCDSFPQSSVGGARSYSLPMSNDIYPFGTEAIIYCKPPTYNPIPTPLTAKCLPSGLWGDAYCSPASGVGPAILLTGLGCGPFPTTMIGGARAYTNATNPSGRYPKMTVAQLHCNDNEYKSFPTPEISYCQANGKWSDNMCQRVNKKAGCSSLKTGNLGKIISYSMNQKDGIYPVGTTASAHCNRPYELLPIPSLLTCEANGKWSNSKCQPNPDHKPQKKKAEGCGDFPYSPFGEVENYHSQKKKGIFPYGTLVNLKCNPVDPHGRPLQPKPHPPSVPCKADGQWGDTNCLTLDQTDGVVISGSGVGCKRFPSSAHGLVASYDSLPDSNGIFKEGTVAVLKCNSNYNSPVPSTVKCLASGKWDDAVCLSTLPNGRAEKIGPSGGCKAMPKANHVTSTSYNNGSIGNDQYAQGSEAITTCKSPFLPSTTPVSSVCLVNGHWSETVCHKPVVNRLEENEPKSCPEFPHSKFGNVVKYSKNKGFDGKYPPMTEATLQCNKPYKPQSTPETVFCNQNTGKWGDATCWHSTNADDGVILGSNGCATFPQSPFGKPVGYSSIPHGGGIYPFNTVVNLTCNQPTFKPDPTPKSVKCLISSRWGDAVCFKTTPGDMGTKLVQGCTAFPPSKFGGVTNYSISQSVEGFYPIKTVARLYCDQKVFKVDPKPPVAYCQPNGKWSDSTCFYPRNSSTGCEAIGKNPFGNPTSYSKGKNSDGRYPIGTAVGIQCHPHKYHPVPVPPTMLCQQNSKWSKATCRLRKDIKKSTDV